MESKTIYITIIAISVLILLQPVSTIDATHNSDKKNEKARSAAEEKSKDFDKDGNKKDVIKEKRDAFVAYKAAFKAWKIAKEDYKLAKSSGVQTDIDAKKIILDAAKITKDNALEVYKEALKKKAR